MLPGAGQDRDRRAVVRFELGKGEAQRIGGRGVDGVAAMVPVDDDGANGAVVFDPHAHAAGIARSTIARASIAASKAP